MTLIDQRYAVQNILGQGGMGIVNRAYDRLTGEVIALKQVLIRPSELQFNSQDESTEHTLALTREFQTLASLRHPHIISVLDYGFDADQQPYFTMSLLEQPRTIREAAASLDIHGRIQLVLELLQAIAYLHRRGILHRDLKPGNVLVDVTGQVKVLDFGLAVAPDQAIGTVGTLAYMAPEVIEKESASEASDLYAVGLMAYELLTGCYPFDTSNIAQLLQDIVGKSIDFSLLPSASTAPALDYNLSPDAEKTQLLNRTPDLIVTDAVFDTTPTFIEENSLAGVLRKLVERNPARRYQHAEAVIEALCRVLELPTPPESQAIRESFLQAATFIGRDVELQQLITAFEQVKTGQGSSWLVAGESGVGKSRLLDEIRIRSLVKGARVLRGQAVSEGGLPYQLWRDPLRWLVMGTHLTDLEAGVLKDIVPDISRLLDRPIPNAPDLDGAARQQRLINTLLDVFKRQTRPIVLLLEDLQWAGESLAVLQALSRTTAALPLLIVGNYRQDEAPDLPNDLPEAQVIHLARLNEAEISALSASMLGTAGRHPDIVELLNRETEGNVFFVVEVVRVLAQEAGRLSGIAGMALPEQVFAGGVWEILERRLWHIPDEYHAALNIAAGIGRQLDLQLLQAIDLALDWEDFLLTCGNAAVLEVQDNRWRFVHDKLREHLLNNLSGDERSIIHRQIAGAIETVYPEEPDRYAMLAYQWGMADDEAKEAHYSDLAGEQAYEISDNYAARRFYERAADLHEHLDAPRLARMYIWLGDTLTRLGDYRESLRYLHLSRTLAREIKDEATEALALLYQGFNHTKRGENSRAIYERVIEIANRIDDPVLLAEATTYLAGHFMLQERNYQLARQHISQALDISRALDAPGVLTRCLTMASAAADHDQDDEAAEQYFQEGLELAEATGDRLQRSELLGNRANFFARRGQIEEAYKMRLEILPLVRAIGAKFNLMIGLINLASFACQLNKIDEADTYTLEVADLAADLSPFYQISVLLNKAEILRVRGAWENGTLLAACVREAMPDDDPGIGEVDQMLSDFRAQLPYTGYIAAVKRGKALSTDEAIDLIREGEV